MKNIKRNITIASVLLLVCAAVYLNWSYNNRWGEADAAMVKAEDAAMKAADEAYEAANTKGSSSGYFAEARLNRQVSREEAMKLLEEGRCFKGNDRCGDEVYIGYGQLLDERDAA